MSLYIVNTTSSALRAVPSHQAEQISRLLLGERFEIFEEADEGRWAFGRGPDEYEGWIRTWHLLPVPPDYGHGLVVTRRWSRVLEAPESDSLRLLDLSFATCLKPAGPIESGFVPWRLPDGRHGWTPAGDLEPIGIPEDESAAGLLEKRGLELLAVPYEWGGRSSAGLDCSGLVQILFKSLGLNLPRDAWQQAERGQAVDRDSPHLWRTGDLLFYGQPRIEHVGLWLGADQLLHASGEVKVETLAPGGVLNGESRPALVAVRRYGFKPGR